MFGFDIEEVVIIEPKIYRDERGFFFESFNEKTFADRISSSVRFVQDNQSLSYRNVLKPM
jgi:dTDP-4-dehydrorhamnose 3,5-epimerase